MRANPTLRLEFVEPMLLRRVRELPRGPEWVYQLKFNGFRMQASKCGGSVRLLSRNAADMSRPFKAIAVAKLKPGTLHLDGEIVAMDGSGRPDFQVLTRRGPLPPHEVELLANVSGLSTRGCNQSRSA